MTSFFLAENSAVFQKSKLRRKKKFVLVASRNLKREQGYSNNTVSLCSLLSQSRLKVKFYYTAVAAAAATIAQRVGSDTSAAAACSSSSSKQQ